MPLIFIELRASSFVVSKDDLLRIIDSYITAFERAVNDGRVRIDNPADFNAMVRLGEFVQGGADSRREMHVALTLEDLQARHRQMLQRQGTSHTAVRGEIQPERTVANERPSSGDAAFDQLHPVESTLPRGSEGYLAVGNLQFVNVVSQKEVMEQVTSLSAPWPTSTLW